MTIIGYIYIVIIKNSDDRKISITSEIISIQSGKTPYANDFVLERARYTAKSSIIKNAHEELINGNFTDDSSMLEALNIPVYAVLGSYTNIKITTKSDLDFAKIYI